MQRGRVENRKQDEEYLGEAASLSWLLCGTQRNRSVIQAGKDLWRSLAQPLAPTRLKPEMKFMP